jgi:hypothetical protein
MSKSEGTSVDAGSCYVCFEHARVREGYVTHFYLMCYVRLKAVLGGY